MIKADIIIVGAGPAGSTCAWKLKQKGLDVILIDKQEFPRSKPCAGWITPNVLKALDISPQLYPHSLTFFNRLHFSFRGIRVPVPTKQFAIRRKELDHWLVNRSGVPLYHHQVKTIRKESNTYSIDESFQCKILIGAGGTGCCVYRSLFKDHFPRNRGQMITTLEEEFEYPVENRNCYLWFFDKGLPGYSWYVPKNGGTVNVGIGGKLAGLKRRGETIRDHWQMLIEKLNRKGLIRNHAYSPKGHNYYLRSPIDRPFLDNCYLIGDAAGLATNDMGEGIGPAVYSGILAAESIVNNSPFSIQRIGKFSFLDVLFPGRKALKD